MDQATPDLLSAVEDILNDGHMNQEHLARLRAAWEACPAAVVEPAVGVANQWPDWLQYDRPADVLTVHGLKYSGHVFESMAIAAPGTWLRITERRDGVLTVRTVDEQREQLFTALAELPPGMVKVVIESQPPSAG